MTTLSLENFPEVFISHSGIAAFVLAEVKKGNLRKVASRLYTKNKTEEAERLVRRHLWPIIAAFFPGALISDRTAIENVPAADGSIFLIAKNQKRLKLPGIIVRSRKGKPALESDKLFINGLFLSSQARAYLENMTSSRARTGIRRTLTRKEIEERLELLLQRSGESAVNKLREEMREIAPILDLKNEFIEMDALLGTLLGTRDSKMQSKPGQARAQKAPYDSSRLDLFLILRDYLASTSSNPRTEKKSDNLENLAFFEAYFSNFIEGTEFSLNEAHQIIFEGKIPRGRPEDAHDVIGTYRLVSNSQEMQKVPKTFEELCKFLRDRHQKIMEARPEKSPGQFKSSINRAGTTVFVAPELVLGTLQKGFEVYQSLQEPFHRAVFMVFFIAEVHPFADGNGRVSRIMMNAELVSALEARIVIPTIYRNNYLVALKTLSQSNRPAPLLRTLDFAQKYTSSLDWSSYEKSQLLLEKTHAFLDPHVADLEGMRLVLPE